MKNTVPGDHRERYMDLPIESLRARLREDFEAGADSKLAIEDILLICDILAGKSVPSKDAATALAIFYKEYFTKD